MQNAVIAHQIFNQNSAIETTLSDRVGYSVKDLVERCIQSGESPTKFILIDDVYLMNNIIYNWDSDRIFSILHNCHREMTDKSKLLLLESLIPASNTNNNQITSSEWLDITIFLMTGGRDRRETKYRELLAKAGFKLTKIVYTQSSISAIEAVKI